MNREITGSVIFDITRPGTTVRSPFEVSGEGDVYEAQFPMEVWAGGKMIAFVGPVWAGAWGTWGPIKVTVTVDAPQARSNSSATTLAGAVPIRNARRSSRRWSHSSWPTDSAITGDGTRCDGMETTLSAHEFTERALRHVRDDHCPAPRA